MEGEMQKLVRLEEVLHERVVGQEAAVEAVANAIRRSRAGLSDPNRPIGSFLFLGPTGVGKTELARSLADFLFDDERPYSVVLLDEVEKAHNDVFNVLLQLLDDGRLTDGQGRTVDFTNVVLIMTSNLPGDPADYFKPEFINRVDDMVRFDSLTKEHLVSIVDIQLRGLQRRMNDRKMQLEVTPAARLMLADLGFDPAYGARPLKRVIQRELADPLAIRLLEGELVDGQTVTVDVADGQLTFS